MKLWLKRLFTSLYDQCGGVTADFLYTFINMEQKLQFTNFFIKSGFVIKDIILGMHILTLCTLDIMDE